MKLSLDKTLSLVALGVVGALGTLPAYAALKDQVYEIVNIEDFDLKGTLKDTQRGYGMGVNANDEVVGVSKGRKKLNDDDVDDGIIDVEDGIAPEEQISYSVNQPILGNNFTFVANPAGNWQPEFDSIGGETPPEATPANSVDAIYYAINDAGTKVGTVSGKQNDPIAYEGDDGETKYWYYRDFEMRGIAKKADGTEVELKPPYTTYIYKPGTPDTKEVNVGGWSVASDINTNQLVAGYGSTNISKSGADKINVCLSDDDTIPDLICIQANQFPDFNGVRGIQYQTRAMVWQLGDTGTVTSTKLPLGFIPSDTDETVYTAQGLGINADGVVAGRSDTYRNGEDFIRFDAGYWKKDEAQQGQYAFSAVPFPNGEYFNTIAYDVNDDGLLIGSYERVIEGYRRTKFFTLDTNNPTEGIKTPADFTGRVSDLSAIPRDINNEGLVVGSVDVTFEKETPRVKAGFLYDSGTESGEEAFIDLNTVLTCESKGLENIGENEWQRHEVKVTDGTGAELSYKADIRVVDATSIADDGTIVGTAFVRKPKYKVDENGDLVLVNGQPVFELNANGQPLTSLLPRAVVLKPSNGIICNYVDPGDNTGPYERKGAAGWAWLTLLPLLWLRRRSAAK